MTMNVLLILGHAKSVFWKLDPMQAHTMRGGTKSFPFMKGVVHLFLDIDSAYT